VQHQKEKELQLQKDDLEFLLSGIRQAVLFSDAMVKEGSEAEFVSGQQQVAARMSTLTKERAKAQLEAVVATTIEVARKEEGMALLESAIKTFWGCGHQRHLCRAVDN